MKKIVTIIGMLTSFSSVSALAARDYCTIFYAGLSEPKMSLNLPVQNASPSNEITQIVTSKNGERFEVTMHRLATYHPNEEGKLVLVEVLPRSLNLVVKSLGKFGDKKIVLQSSIIAPGIQNLIIYDSKQSSINVQCGTMEEFKL